MPLSFLQGPHKNAGETATPRNLASAQSEVFGLKGHHGLLCPTPFTDESHRNDENIDRAPIDLNTARDQNAENQIVSTNTADCSTRAYRPQWCCGCGNGGNVISCDYCPRVMCNNTCVMLRAPPEVLSSRNVSFICPACHERWDRTVNRKKKTPYKVSRPTVIFPR
jgi:hypothetical protein